MAQTTALSALMWLQILGLGGMCGAIGQAARAIVGFKKLNDAASAANTTPIELVEASRLVVSLGIGFVVGALAATQILKGDGDIQLQQIIQIAATGYAGTDFLEGFIRRSFGVTDNTAGSGSPSAGSSTSADGAVG